MKKYTIVSFVGSPEAYKQPQTSYIRIAHVEAKSAKEAVMTYEMDKYDKSLGYVMHSKDVSIGRSIKLPDFIYRAIHWFYLNLL